MLQREHATGVQRAISNAEQRVHFRICNPSRTFNVETGASLMEIEALP